MILILILLFILTGILILQLGGGKLRKIIAIVNQKGGVAKTTTAINLGSSLVELGKKVLLIDMDPQANLTQGIGLKKQEQTIYGVLKGEVTFKEAIYKTDIIPNNWRGQLDVLPSSIKLANAELELSGELGREKLLQGAYEETDRLGYDYILIDCNPSLGLLTVNSLSIADNILIPIEPSIFALDGIQQLLDVIKLIKKKINSDLNIMGVLLTRVDGRTNIAKDFEEDLKEIFNKKVFNTMIHQNVKISEAQTEQLPINLFDKKARGAEEYYSLAKEVISYEGKYR